MVTTWWTREEWRFPLRFLGWASLLWFAVDVGILKPSLGALRSGTSQLVVGSSFLTGLPATANSDAVVTFGNGSFSYWISEGCTAWAAALLYVSAVLAYPAPWRKRGFGILIGLPLVFGLNVVRLVSMAWMGIHWPAFYEQAHGVWWQVLVILSVGLGWLAWARFVEAERRGKTTRGRLRELGVSVALFLAIVAALQFAAAWTGLARTYGTNADSVSSFLSRFLFRTQGDFFWAPGSLEFEHSLLFGGLAGIVALYLATPRIPVRARLLGVVTLGAPSQFVFDAFSLAIRQASLVGNIGRTYDAFLFARILAWGGAVVVWYVFARHHWVRMLDQQEAILCPSCGSAPTDLFGHLRSAHRLEARRLRRALLALHPALRGEWHRIHQTSQRPAEAELAHSTPGSKTN